MWKRHSFQSTGKNVFFRRETTCVSSCSSPRCCERAEMSAAVAFRCVVLAGASAEAGS